MQPEHRLWAGVLLRGVEDYWALRRGHQPFNTDSDCLWHVNQVSVWLLDDLDNQGSFVWICRILNLDPVKIRGKVLAGDFNKKLLRDSYHSFRRPNVKSRKDKKSG